MRAGESICKYFGSDVFKALSVFRVWPAVGLTPLSSQIITGKQRRDPAAQYAYIFHLEVDITFI